jgi:hypothetical protein
MKVVELALFKLKANASQAEFNSALAATQAWLARQPGFILRRHGVSDAAERLDYVEWESSMAAKAALDAFKHAPELQPFMAAIDAESIIMRHFNLIL